MSILLDAVIKSKQQTTHIDPVLTPRQQYEQLHKNDFSMVKIIAILSTIMVAVVFAWWLSSTKKEGLSPQSASINIPVAHEQQSKIKDKLQAEVELAGKSALPIAEVYSGSSEEKAAKPSSAVVKKQDIIPSNVADDVTAEQADVTESKPIILGRQPSANELAQIQSKLTQPPESFSQRSALSKKQQQQLSLEALKRQIAVAASEVGLKTSEQQNQAQLVQELNAALRQTERKKSIAQDEKLDVMNGNKLATQYTKVPTYGELPVGIQLQVPEFTINAHMYSSVPSQRRLNIDGRQLKEGDTIKGDLKILEIRPRDVVLDISGHHFKVAAM